MRMQIDITLLQKVHQVSLVITIAKEERIALRLEQPLTFSSEKWTTVIHSWPSAVKRSLAREAHQLLRRCSQEVSQSGVTQQPSASLIICPSKNTAHATFLPWSFGIWFHLPGLFLIAGAVKRHSSVNSLNDPAVLRHIFLWPSRYVPLKMMPDYVLLICSRPQVFGSHHNLSIFIETRAPSSRVFTYKYTLVVHRETAKNSAGLGGSHAFFQSDLRLLMFTSNNS